MSSACKLTVLLIVLHGLITKFQTPIFIMLLLIYLQNVLNIVCFYCPATNMADLYRLVELYRVPNSTLTLMQS